MWWNGRALGFDTETDEPVPTEARIITGALVHMPGGGERPRPLEVLLKPERDIPQEAIDVHGITTERAQIEGIARETGVATIAEGIAEVAGPEVPVVGHNAVYDLTLLDREMRRLGLGWLEIERDVFAQIGQVRMILGTGLAATFPMLDTLVLDKAFDRYRKGSRRLTDVARHYGVPMGEGTAHGATADAIASLRIAIAIANRGGFEGRSLADLHCAQVKWKAEQAESLKDYFRRTGAADPDSVSTDWPLQAISLDESRAIADATF